MQPLVYLLVVRWSIMNEALFYIFVCFFYVCFSLFFRFWLMLYRWKFECYFEIIFLLRYATLQKTKITHRTFTFHPWASSPERSDVHKWSSILTYCRVVHNVHCVFTKLNRVSDVCPWALLLQNSQNELSLWPMIFMNCHSGNKKYVKCEKPRKDVAVYQMLLWTYVHAYLIFLHTDVN